MIRRPIADPDEVEAVARLLAHAQKPIIIAGGGVVYSGATAELEELAGSAGIPVLETMAGKGAVQQRAWWQLGGIGLEGTPANNDLVRQADFVLTVGSRLTDFPTASQSLFENPDVQFASINVNGYDAQRLGATGIVGDAKRALAALAAAVQSAGYTSPAEWQDEVRSKVAEWEPVRAAALDPDTPFDRASIPADFPDVVPDTGALLTQGQVIGLLQEHARAGDTIVAAAGGPPGDLQKVWDATEGRFCHLEFGFSCMGYEIPAGMGVRLADPNPDSRVVVFIGDGTFLMSPTELVTAAQESIAVTVVIPENRGYQVIHRLQMGRHGTEFGNEFRYRTSPLDLAVREEGASSRAWTATTSRSTSCRSRRASAPAASARTPPTRCAPRWTRPAATRARSSSSSRSSRTSTCPAPGRGGTSPRPRCRRTRPSSACAPSTRPGCPSSSGSADSPFPSSAKRVSIMTETREIGVGLISVGWMGKLHTRAYQAMPSVYPELGVKCRLVIAADTAPDRVEYAKDVLGYERGTTDYREVLADPDVDVVSICAPNMLHREIGIAAAKAGKPFWIEKPVGRDAAETAEVAAAAREAGVATSIGYNYRHAPAIERMRELIADGTLGRITNIRSVFLNGYASEPKGALSWRFQKEFSGSGAMGDLLSHVADLVQYVVGPIDEVTALSTIIHAERPILPMGSGTHFAVIEDGEMGTVENEDYGAVLARFAPNSRGAGAVGTLECSRVVVGPQCGLSIEVYGTEGSATWSFERMNELKLAVGRGGAHAGYTTVLGNPGMGDYAKFQPGPGNSMGYDDLKVIEAKKFLQSVTQGVPGACTIDDAQSAAEVVSAAVSSAASGSWVKVPAVPGATYGGEPATGGAGR